MTKILIRGTQSTESIGVHAMTICTMEILDKSRPNVEFYIFSTNPDIDHRLYDKYGFNLCVVKGIGGSKAMLSHLFRVSFWRALNKCIRLDARRLLNDEVLQTTYEADIVVDMLGDGFSYDIGGLGGNISPIGHSLTILLATSLGKDTVLFPQSIGPFRTKLVKYLAKFALNKAKAIIVREELSKDYLISIGVNKPPLYITADTAFILEPASYERIHEILANESFSDYGALVIGINISQLLNHKSKNLAVKEDYITLMAKLTDYLIENLDVCILFVPHEITAYELKNETNIIGGDDIVAVKEAYEKVKNKNKVIPFVNNEYSASELKGIIGLCDMFIGARMHSNIAAISLCIPTIAVSYSIKAPGIMKMVGLEEYTCDFRTMTFEELKTKVSGMWQKREKLKEEMSPKVKDLKESVWFNGKLVKDIVAKRK